MKTGYFQEVSRKTATRLWINNPTASESALAIEAGAIACTTNPTFAARMLRMPESREAALRIVDGAIMATGDDSEAASLVQRRLIADMAMAFLPLFEASRGQEGFVSLQLDPHHEESADRIVAEALADFALFPNCIAKIPVIPSGLAAIDCLVRLNKPVIATEIMAVSQMLAVCETYRRASAESGHTPAFYVTHISGILDDQLKAEAEQAGAVLSAEAVRLAGVAIAKKQYRLMRERSLPGILLGGGARGLHHFTELVGGKAHVTVNWLGTADTLIETAPAIENRMDAPVPEAVIRELCALLPTFDRAWREDGLTPAEFAAFSPVVRFRNQFLSGWNELLATIAARRAVLSVPVRSFFHLGDAPAVEMRPGIFRSTLIHNPETMLCHFHEKAGAHIDLHTHVPTQGGYVLRGRVRFFDKDGTVTEAGPGDAYLFGSNEPHGSDALEETDLLEFFVPARPEYLD